MGKKGYESAFKGEMGSGLYQPAYKTKVREGIVEESISRKPTTKSPVEETQPQRKDIAPTQPVDRFNTRNWQSLGFPNTLPQSARGSLFRPAPPQQVVPMVRQPYQPREQPTPMPARRAPMSGPMPRIGLNLNVPTMMRPQAPVTPPRPATPQRVMGSVPSAGITTFMGVNLSEKKKEGPKKPLTRMGEGYKNVPLYLMNGVFPSASYNPNKDPIMKKSIVPKINATISTKDFTMFGMRVKNKKN